MAGNPNIEKAGIATRFTSTNQPKNRGRKPSVYKKLLKDSGMGADDARLIAKALLDMTKDKLKSLLEHPRQTIWVQSYAKKLIKDLIENKIEAIAHLEERAYGKSVQPLEHSGNIDVVQYTPEERKKFIDDYIKNRQDQMPGGGSPGTDKLGSPPGESQKTIKKESGEIKEEDS